MNSDYLIQAWWKAMETAGLRSRHTGSNAGTGEPLDPTLRIYKATCDGGGPSLWGGERPVFVELSQIGVVRAADIYGGKTANGKGRWRTWPEIKKKYLRGEVRAGNMTRIRSAYAELIRGETRQPTAVTDWLHWYTDVSTSGGVIRESVEVEKRLHQEEIGWNCIAVLRAKGSGLKDGTNVYLVEWQDHNSDERTWETRESIRHHWRIGESWRDKGGENARKREADQEMRVCEAKGVTRFHFQERMQDRWGEEKWSQFIGRAHSPGSGNEGWKGEEDAWDEVIAELQEHSRDTRVGHNGGDGRALERRAKEEGRWEVDQRQQLFGGEVMGGVNAWEQGEDRNPTITDPGDGSGQDEESEDETEESLEINEERAWRGLATGVETQEAWGGRDVDGEEATAEQEGHEADWEETDTWQARHGPVGTHHTPRNKDEEWPLGEGKGRAPSLAASNEAEEERVRMHYEATPKQQPGRTEGDMSRRRLKERKEEMRTSGEEGEDLYGENRDGWEAGNMVERVTARHAEIETAWSRGHPEKGRRALYRGIYHETHQQLREGSDLDARRNKRTGGRGTCTP